MREGGNSSVLFNLFVFVLWCTVKLYCFQGMFSTIISIHMAQKASNQYSA